MPSGRLDRYQIVGPLGEGGMGTIWLARDPDLDRDVVLKSLKVHLTSSENARERLLHEARALSRLDHPNIIGVYDLVESEGRWYLCMQHIAGRTLRDIMKGGSLPFSDVLRHASGMASGLAAAHRAGIIHRDIKPENVMVTNDGVVKVLDFGIAAAATGVEPSLDHMSSGSLLAMAPEQFEGVADPRSDIFALGSVLYEMTAGVHPFAGGQATDIAIRIMEKPPPPLSELRTGVPFELLHLISKCLEKDPDLRYQDAEDVLADLRRLDRELRGGAADVPVAIEKRGALDRLRTPQTGGRLEAVPAVPAIPGGKVLAGLLAAGLLAVAALMTWHPERGAQRELTIGLDQAGTLARQMVERGGSSLYGYSSHTDASNDEEVGQFEGHQRLGVEDRRALEVWRPASYFRHVLVSADHQEKYEVHVGPTGRILSIRHGLRPDHPVAAITPDSADQVADAVLRNDLGLDPGRLTALPAADSFEEGRPIREYKWKATDALPGGTIGTVSIRLAGPLPIEAAASAQLPPLVTRAILEMTTPAQNLASVVIAVILIAAAVLAVRRGLILIPGLRLFVVLPLVFSVLFLANQWRDWSRTIVEQGSKALIGEFAGLVWITPIIGVILCVVAGFCLGILSAEEPRSVAGLGHVLRSRISRATWARSALVGLPLGAVGAAMTILLRRALEMSGLAHAMPEGSTKIFESGLPQLTGQLLETFMLWFALCSVMASLVLLRSALRVGAWIWPGGVLLLSLAITSRANFSYQPYQLNLVLAAAWMALFLWIGLRYGLLAGLAAGFSWQLLSLIRRMISLPIPDLHGEAALYLGLWLALLGAAFLAVRPWQAGGRSPESPALTA